MPPVGGMDYASFLKELKDIQNQLFDKASTYTKLILGLGYGAFFAAWSGSRQYLLPKQLILSVLLMTVSLLLYIIFEVFQTGVLSYLSISFAKAVNTPDQQIAEALQRYRSNSVNITRKLAIAWFVIYPITVTTGFGGAGILVAAFIRSVWRMR